MSKVINCSIDVSMIDKSKIKIHANGSHYWNFTVAERKEPDTYGNTHYVTEQRTKEQKAAGEPLNYLKSSGKEYVFQEAGQPQQQASNAYADQADEDDLPF